MLGGFLQPLGVDARSLSADLDQRVALHRGALAFGREVLSIVDRGARPWPDPSVIPGTTVHCVGV
jgi:hypothetical protein